MNWFDRLLGRKQERATDSSWDAVKTNGLTASGFSGYINPKAAEQVSAVFAAVEVITNAVATLPPKIYSYSGEDRILQIGHPLAGLLSKPNRHQTWPEFIRDYLADVLLFGNACAVYQGRELIYIPWRRVYVDQASSGRLRYRYTRPTIGSENQPQIVALEDEVLHVRDRGDGVLGIPRLSRCSGAVNLAITMQNAAEGVFKNGVFPSGVFNYKGKLDPKKRQDIATQIQSQFSGDNNRGRVLLTDQEIDFNTTQVSPESMEFVSARSFQIDEIARVFNVPVVMLQKLDNASYSNASQQSRFLSSHSLVYWTALFESAFNDLLLDDNERLELDLSVFTRGDPTERWAAYKTALEQGVLTPADVRHLEGWDSLGEDDSAVSTSDSNDTQQPAISVVGAPAE